MTYLIVCSISISIFKTQPSHHMKSLQNLQKMMNLLYGSLIGNRLNNVSWVLIMYFFCVFESKQRALPHKGEQQLLTYSKSREHISITMIFLKIYHHHHHEIYHNHH